MEADVRGKTEIVRLARMAGFGIVCRQTERLKAGRLLTSNSSGPPVPCWARGVKLARMGKVPPGRRGHVASAGGRPGGRAGRGEGG